MTDDTTDVDTDDEATQETAEAPQEEETYTRDYVKKLRDENAKARVKAKAADEANERADALAHRLHLALVEQDGRLQDARDLPFRPEHLEDPDALTDAITALLEDRPTLANRRPKGDAGQGPRGTALEPVSLLNILKGCV